MGCAGSGRAADPSSSNPAQIFIREPPPAVVPESFHKQYLILSKLGKGAFAQVHLARKLATGEELAVKVTDLRVKANGGRFSDEIEVKTRRAVQKEVSILRMLGPQENCVCYCEHFTEGVLAYVVMERCTMTLLQALERLPELTEQRLLRMFKEMLSSLFAIHKISIVHRDVKPDNFLCIGEEATVKLCDFGLAEVLAHQKDELNSVYGTAPFMSPEMLGAQGYGAKTDVWSLGIIVYVLLLGQFPYQPAECTAKAMKAAIASGFPEPTFKPRSSLAVSNSAAISPQGVDFLKTTLRRNPESRPDAREALQHRWLEMAGDEPQSKGTGSLHPMLFSAKRCGAFDTRKVHDDEKIVGSIDSLLIAQQIKHHGSAAMGSSSRGKKPEKPPSECGSGSRGHDVSTMVVSGSTNTGGSLQSSQQSHRNRSAGMPKDVS